MTNLEKTYQPHQIEPLWYSTWENKGYFTPSYRGQAYCIMLPPPNVTGSLHMGHGFGFTLMDVLIRYQRMLGKNTLWQTGTDHAGIATQMVVERQLNQLGQTRHDLGREAFVKKIWAWKTESGGTIMQQLRRLGASMDWQRECFTMDEPRSYAVREVFIRLYQEGLIYRGKRLVNWDPVLLTAISDLEVVNEEETGHLWHIQYPVVDAKEVITVATTRPETLLGDMAVAVHPEDERYRHLIGKQVQLPLTQRTIPIIGDEYVEREFGSGCVKITPAHDFNDYAIGLRHNLEAKNIFTPTAHLNENVPVPYQGLDRFAARKKIVEDLQAQNLIAKIEPHTLKVPRGDRSGAVIEPYLTQQWYVKSEVLAKPAIEAVENGEIKFIPDVWTKTYYQWMHHIEDWCISRQLWWGHRIPIWYDKEGNAYAGHDEALVREQYQLCADIHLEQDPDVLDTWFSSALWPFATLGWPHNSKEMETFFPTDVLITGFDIIFFWVARMIMMSLKFTGQIPFKEVYITGLIRDAEGHKMSKSKGNVLDPIDLIDGIQLDELIKKRTFGLMQPKMAEKITKNTQKEFPAGIPSFGTDALRFTFCSMASYTREIRFDIQRLSGYRNFCNKLWNAARYVLMNVGSDHISVEHAEYSIADEWIWTQLQYTIEKVHAAFADYRFDQVAQLLYEFTWDHFCDWYLELSKAILNNANTSLTIQGGTRYTLLAILENLLRLLHPITPYITEDIWQRVAPLLKELNSESIMLAPFPQVDSKHVHQTSYAHIEKLKTIIIAIRTIRSEMVIPPGKPLKVYFKNSPPTLTLALIQQHEDLLKLLAKLSTISYLGADEAIANAATALVGDLEIYIPFEDLINVEEEILRLEKDMGKLQKDLLFCQHKLNNPAFTDKAPPAVVLKERERLEELQLSLAKLTARHRELKANTPQI